MTGVINQLKTGPRFAKDLFKRNQVRKKISVAVHNTSENTNSTWDRKKSYFVTTPIFYVNAQPHIGHLYSALIADAACRFNVLKGVCASSVIFSTGTDEHGLKVQQSAFANNSEPKQFCDQVSGKFRDLFDIANIRYTDYIRTVEERHIAAVQHFLKILINKEQIYLGNYSGWYCVSDEAYLTDLQVEEVELVSGEKQLVSGESGHPVEWNSETNYMFRLSNFCDDIQYWLKQDDRVKPKRFLDQLRGWVNDELPDLSVSRPSDRVSWGIPVPGDDSHTVYVWVDALINYLTVAGYPDICLWPPDVQVIGKDILKFHGIYWPALLIAAGLEPPRSLLCHSHWTVSGKKMSKSRGNVVCPVDRAERYTADGLRYFLLRQGTPHSDSNWDEKHAVELLNVELANTLGTLLNRCIGSSLNPKHELPPLSQDYLHSMSDTGKQLVELLKKIPDAVENHYLNFNFYCGINVIMEAIRQANKFVDEERPWELKNLPDRTKLDSILRVALEATRIAGVALQPIIPSISSLLLDILGIPSSHRSWGNLHNGFGDNDDKYLSTSFNLGSRAKLFNKIR